MIPQDYIIEWSQQAPWQTLEQVEQDLAICRVLVEIYSSDLLASNLAFRGATALYKLYLQPQPRYSEDIDLVQIITGAFGPLFDELKTRLAFLGEAKRMQKQHNNTLIYHFESEFPPTQRLRLKIETNCREHFNALGLVHFPFAVESSWFTGNCRVTTYSLEELLATKLRALYQRKKGRDLYDLYQGLSRKPSLDDNAVVRCWRCYMEAVVDRAPSQSVFLDNLHTKLQDSEFLGDITALLHPQEHFNWTDAYELVKSRLIELI